MALRVSTISSDVTIADLGLVFFHPTVCRDISLEFSSREIRDSANLTTVIQSGLLLVDDGTFAIAGEDYDPDFVLLQQLALGLDVDTVSEAELLSSGDIYIKSDVFPLSVNSIASSTKNIYCPTAKWITWSLAENDKVVISGNAAAGTYTVDSIVDQHNFHVKEFITTATGGTISIYHPSASTKIGVNTTSLTLVSGHTLQEVVESIDDKLGEVVGANVGVLGFLIFQTDGGLVYNVNGDVVIKVNE
jgi:hypothetical protein